MKSYHVILAVILAILFLIPLSGFSAPVYASPERPTKSITIKAVPMEQAVSLIKAGQLDAYLFPAPRDIAAANLGSSDVKFLFAPAGINDFILNPAEPKDPNKLNPFVSRRIRYAINYLVDRQFMVQQIFKGFAYEMYTFESPADPDYLTIADIVAEYKTPYNPEYAAQIISEEMTKLGAEKGEDGYWYYNGQPVTINFVIRIEDERHELGLMLADELEKVGFKVNRLEMTFGEAIDLVYYTDPADLDWMIYTEGWGKGGLVKWDDGGPSFWGAPWYGLMPGWGEPEFWNYQNDTIDELSLKLYTANFTSQAERNKLFREVTKLIMNEAVRIYAVTTLDPFPMSPDMLGVTEDLASGLRSLYNLRELYIPGKDSLQVGHLHVYTSRTLWGPVDARNWHFFDVYSVDPWTAVHDPWLYTHPFTGEVMPFRTPYTVETAGPTGTLEVPSDAFIWDPVNKEWKTIGEGVTAKSKVTFDLSKLLGTDWHDGKPITWADVLYDIYLFWEWTYASDKQQIDPIWFYYFGDVLNYTKAYRIVDGDKLEVYIDYWHFDPNEIASWAAPPVTYFPWEVNYAVEQLVLDGKYAFNRYMANAYGIPQINYVLSGHASDAVAKMQELKSHNQFPENVFTVNGHHYCTLDEAKERYQSAINWINDKGHMVISNGPFYLENFDAAGDSLVLKAFEDETYPFLPGTWVFGNAVKPQIQDIFAPPVNLGSESTIIIDASGPTPMGLLYTIRDPKTGEILSQGNATAVTPYRFEISLSAEFTNELGPGTYEIELLLYSPEVAALDFKKAYFTILGTGALGEAVSDLNDRLNSLSQDLEKVSATLASAINDLRSALMDALDSISTAIGDVRGDVQTVSTDVSSVAGDVKDLNSKVGALEGAVNQLTIFFYVLLILVIIDIVVSALALRKG